MTREDLCNDLTEAFACALGGFETVNQAVRAFAQIGERVRGITLRVDVETEPLPGYPSRAGTHTSADSDFLRSLRIAPDLTPEGTDG